MQTDETERSQREAEERRMLEEGARSGSGDAERSQVEEQERRMEAEEERRLAQEAAAPPSDPSASQP